MQGRRRNQFFFGIFSASNPQALSVLYRVRRGSVGGHLISLERFRPRRRGAGGACVLTMNKDV
jgi:hypothetical protein